MTNDMISLIQLLITALAAVGASSGFWVYMDRRRKHRDLTRKLLIGLAHDRIFELAMSYINQGCVTTDQYENLYKFLYEPYIELGGNGSAKRLMESVKKLPLFDSDNYIQDRLKKINQMKGDSNVQ